jgi:hypothetical protein
MMILMNPPKIITIKVITESVTVYKIRNVNYRIISLSNGKTIITGIRNNYERQNKSVSAKNTEYLHW